MELQNMKETELCLGLPGGVGNGSSMKMMSLAAGSKRVFSETGELSSDELKLKLQTKAQVVGWPPVRAHRKNVMKTQKNAAAGGSAGGGAEAEEACFGGAFVKVSIDGAPYLRKVDLKMYKSYQELSDALAKLFSSFTKGNGGEDGMIDFMNESKLRDALNCSDYAKTYQDKDGDWMLVGDVPWEMFVKSCKRLRIMKRSEAKGLAPEPVEKSE